MWIEGQLGMPSEGTAGRITGPMVIGRDWLLEMIRTETGRTRGFYWAPFAIVTDFPDLVQILNGYFVGFSLPSKPPAPWLTTSMTFDLGTAALARTPREFIDLISEPRTFVEMERTASSPLSMKAKRLIAGNFNRTMSIAEIAGVLGVSHAHLTRQFKRDFGLTPVEYQHRLRVSEAMSRLSLGEAILDTGYDVGFNDTTRFYSAFRKVTGTSPGRCRRPSH